MSTTLETKEVILNTPIAGHRHDEQGRVTGTYQHAPNVPVSLPLADADGYIAKGYAVAVEVEAPKSNKKH